MLRLWVEARTGLHWRPGGEFLDLSSEEWRSSRELLASRMPALVAQPDGHSSLERWYRARADDAHSSGDVAAYRYDLERLAELRPQDWLVLGLQLASYADAGHFTEADAMAARVDRIARAEDLTNWYWYRGVDQLNSTRSDSSLWYLDRVVAARPRDWRVAAYRSDLFDRLGKTADATREGARAVACGADAGYVGEFAGERASEGAWLEASRLLDTAEPRGHVDRAFQALVCLKCGDRAGYRRACAKLLEENRTLQVGWVERLNAAWMLGLEPNAIEDYSEPLQLITSVINSLARMPREDAFAARYRHAARMTRAILLLRAGRAAEAERDFEPPESPDALEAPDALYGVAKHTRSVPAESAPAILAKTVRELSAKLAHTTNWQDQAELEIIRAQAETALLDSVFPADPFAEGCPCDPAK